MLINRMDLATYHEEESDAWCCEIRRAAQEPARYVHTRTLRVHDDYHGTRHDAQQVEVKDATMNGGIGDGGHGYGGL